MTPNLSSPYSTVGEEILLELRNTPLVDRIRGCAPSPEYHPTSPPPNAPHQCYSKSEALEIAEAMIVMREMGEFSTAYAGNTPGVSEAICMSISPIPPPTPENEHCIPPSEEEVHNMQKLAQGIIRYHAAHPTPLKIVKDWTDHLMGAIRVMSRSGEPAHPVPITNDTFDDLSHLRFIPIFINIINPYMEDSNGSVDTPPPTLLQHIATPAEMAHASTQTEDTEDTDHPGGQWMCFSPSNTSHYPLVFIGTDTRLHVAKYICYLSVNDGVVHQGTEGKDKAIYGTPLHA